ncbi:MAG: PDZ domain-containing protein [Bacteroidales bacterium]|nr:PDZ domain-containing protein [Bacteroidales bacterium]
MKRVIKFCLIIVFFTSCNSQQIKDNNQLKSKIPQGSCLISYRGHIYIEGVVDSVKGSFVFDTGANNFYLDTLFYQQNNFRYKNLINAKIPGAGTSVQDIKVILDSVNFQFSDHYYKTPIVPILSLKPILGDYADGILGLDYFLGKVLQIDYKHEYIKVYDNIDSADICEYSKIQYENIDNRLYIPLKIQINDSLKIEGKFQLDFGSGGSISLTSTSANSYNLHNVINTKIRYWTKYGGIGGESSSYVFKAKLASIGDYHIDDIVMSYSLDTAGAMSSEKHLGLIGNKILEKFDVLIDFKTNVLYLKPNTYFEKPFEFSRLGFSFVDRNETYGAWIVTGFYDGSPAETSGLKIDDRISHINNEPITEISYDQQKELFKELHDIRLTVKRDEKTLNFTFKLQEVIKDII